MTNWSNEQQNIFDRFTHTHDNLCINAAPGSGKTTVLKQLWELSPNTATLYLAFSKSIVQEAEQKMSKKDYSSISTFNSLGARLCSSNFKSKLDVNKVYKHIKSTVEHLLPQKTRDKDRYSLYTLVQYCKSNLGITSLEYPFQARDAIQDLIDYFDLEEYPDIIQHCQKVLESSNKDTKTIDFADQLLLPVLYDLQFPLYELCLVDEAQDVNNIQREILWALKDRNTDIRYVYVGDAHQAIYSFRGALSDSLRVLSDEFGCDGFPLTYTYRCSKNIVRAAQALWPNDIRYLEDSREGIVRNVLNDDNLENEFLKPVERKYPRTIQAEIWNQESFILCRTMAPLVNFAYQLLRANTPCQVKGRDIGKSFISYIQKSNTVYVNDFLEYMDRDIGEKIERAQIKKDSNKILALYDKMDTLKVFSDAVQSVYVSDVIVFIENLFKEGKGITLSTIHRSKGLEADKVFILAADLMPHPLATKPWEIEQESNIQYVAITRAKNELVYI